MKLFLLILLFVFPFSTGCDNKKKEMEDRHAQKLKLMGSVPEILFDQMPDSMKQWVPIFTKVWQDDQRYRSIEDQDMLHRYEKEQAILDSVNLETVTKFIDRYGIPNYQQAGFKVSQAIKIVIQHAPLSIQEKYYPAFVEAVKNKGYPSVNLGMLEDRINMRNNRRQYYGTQLMQYKNKWTLYPW